MRLIATADLHIGLRRYGRETPNGNSRVLDFAATLARFADAAIENECHFAVLLGDNFHTRQPGPREMTLFTEQVKRMVAGRVRVLILPGNHDGMDTVGDPKSHTLAWMRAADLPGVVVLTEPGVQSVPALRNQGRRLTVASIPYPHRRALALEGSPDERTEETSRRVERMIEAYSEEARRMDDGPTVFFGHLSVLSARLGSEQTMRIGYDVAVRPEVFAGFDLALLGHIHRPQRIEANAWYVGAPDFHLFEDAGQSKAFMLVDFNIEGPALSRIDSKPRPMAIFPCSQHEDGTFRDTDIINAALDGHMVELKLIATVERPRQAEQARLRELAMQAGASFVKIDIVYDLPETHERVSIRAEDAPEAALEAWIGAQEDIPMEPTLSVGKQLIASVITDTTT